MTRIHKDKKSEKLANLFRFEKFSYLEFKNIEAGKVDSNIVPSFTRKPLVTRCKS